jgi:hypothetical protein
MLENLYRNPGQIGRRGRGQGGGSGFYLSDLLSKGGLKSGEFAFIITVGRPLLGCTMGDIDKITSSLAKVGVFVEPTSTVGRLMSDSSAGKIRDDVLAEKFYYLVVQFKTDESKLADAVSAMQQAAKQVDTVFSVAVVVGIGADHSIAGLGQFESRGVSVRPNGKLHLDLARSHREA